MSIRHSDLIRDYVRDNVLPAYNPAITWSEDKQPFTMLDEPIIYCRQQGRGVDAFVRQVSVDIYIVSPSSWDNTTINDTFDDALLALEYLKANPRVTDECLITVTNDVTGEYHTAQGRINYRFTVMCYT